jgi:hypothetical protein
MLLTLSIQRFVCFGVILMLTLASALMHTRWSLWMSAIALILIYGLAYRLMNSWATGRLRTAFIRALSEEVDELVARFSKKNVKLNNLQVQEMRHVLLGQFWYRHDLLLCLIATLLFLVAATVNLANINHVVGLYPQMPFAKTIFLTGLDISTASIDLAGIPSDIWVFSYRGLGIATITYLTGFFLVAVFNASKELNENFIRNFLQRVN